MTIGINTNEPHCRSSYSLFNHSLSGRVPLTGKTCVQHIVWSLGTLIKWWIRMNVYGMKGMREPATGKYCNHNLINNWWGINETAMPNRISFRKHTKTWWNSVELPLGQNFQTLLCWQHRTRDLIYDYKIIIRMFVFPFNRIFSIKSQSYFGELWKSCLCLHNTRFVSCSALLVRGSPHLPLSSLRHILRKRRTGCEGGGHENEWIDGKL